MLTSLCPSDLRDGAKAAENAIKACELTNWKNYGYVATLMAAYSEAGNFTAAVNWQKKNIDSLTEEEEELSGWKAKVRANYESRLKLYQSGKPYRENPQATPD